MYNKKRIENQNVTLCNFKKIENSQTWKHIQLNSTENSFHDCWSVMSYRQPTCGTIESSGTRSLLYE